MSVSSFRILFENKLLTYSATIPCTKAFWLAVLLPTTTGRDRDSSTAVGFGVALVVQAFHKHGVAFDDIDFALVRLRVYLLLLQQFKPLLHPFGFFFNIA